MKQRRKVRLLRLWLPDILWKGILLEIFLSLFFLYLTLLGNLQNFKDSTMIMLMEIHKTLLVFSASFCFLSGFVIVYTRKFRIKMHSVRVEIAFAFSFFFVIHFFALQFINRMINP